LSNTTAQSIRQLSTNPTPSWELAAAKAEHRRALDKLSIAVHQGRVSPSQLNGMRQRNAQRTAAATACGFLCSDDEAAQPLSPSKDADVSTDTVLMEVEIIPTEQ